MIKIGLYDIANSTTPESNKSLPELCILEEELPNFQEQCLESFHSS
jgi:hypothetical protein